MKLPKLFNFTEFIDNLSQVTRSGGLYLGRDTSYKGLCGKAPPERSTIFRRQVYKGVGISQVEEYLDLSFRSVKVPLRANRRILWP